MQIYDNLLLSTKTKIGCDIKSTAKLNIYRTKNIEQRTKNKDQRTKNIEPRSKNKEHRT
jgi:hypothetical protein